MLLSLLRRFYAPSSEAAATTCLAVQRVTWLRSTCQPCVSSRPCVIYACYDDIASASGAHEACLNGVVLPQGRLATLCASLILVNPIAKFALTLEPVAAAATGAAEGVSGGEAGKRTASHIKLC